MYNLGNILLPIISEIRAGRKSIEVSELWGASRALFLFGLMRESGRPLIVVTATEEEAEALAEDLRFFGENRAFFAPGDAGGSDTAVFTFPAWGVLPFEADSPDTRTVGERMRFLYELVSGRTGIYVVPLRSLLQKLPPWDLFAGSVKTIRPGEQHDPGDVVHALLSAGYESASLVTRAGEVSRRGGIIDFFSPARERPVRMEFFGDTIESLREFDPETQRSVAAVDQAVALPVRELIITQSGVSRFEKRLREAAGEDGLTRPAQELLDQIEQETPPPGAEFLAPFFYDMEGLFKYLPDNCIVALIEPEDIEKTAEEERARIMQGRAEEAAEGRVLPGMKELYLETEELEAGLSQFPLLNLRLLGMAGVRHGMDTKSASWLGVRLTRSLAAAQAERESMEGSVAALVEKLKTWRASSRIAAVCGTEEAGRRLRNMFMEYGLAPGSVAANEDRDTGPFPVALMTGRLSSGFSWPGLDLIVITEEDIFGAKAHSRGRTAKSKVAPFLSSFKELKPGDFVVHRDYGVGEYQGLSHISVDGFETDFLALRYEPDAKLYVPLYSLDKVQKYIGMEGGAPKLARLGAPAWARTREKVKKDILEMARQLVAVYAAREAMERSPFTRPDNLYREFESAFPYEETEDQEKAIEDVLMDMQKPRPMDRVVCGDVGYGKTEVALRAAFKAVEDRSQVAILVPTTLLADQHHRTFSERLGPFSIAVETLSRFRTKAEQKAALAGLRNGTVDIVIGTHRLLQKDVTFKNLGLLVVDEEHRFGVKHKERIKEFKKLVDVLTLTATPIPRTLHMSLAGLRDLSIIQTPPLDRQAIQVVLARFGKRVVREAILHELGRNGQVFFLHNRVQGIERMADFVQNLVPEAQVGIAHGQMKEDAIEDVMSRFIAGGLNVLVTTSIIESGIDIPNANTIIINRADRFGLAELYQIKGRVGRGRRKAFAYLLTPAEEGLSDLARKRLRAIQELSELGAGFRIAAQDLETRGAGNLLGKQQSGHIAAVGIDLYTEMMEEAMAEIRGEEVAKEQDTQINLRASAFIPEDYIEDVSLRLAAYKEISGGESSGEIDRIAEDLQDRYGPLPEPASNLLEIMKVRIIAKQSRVARIDGGTAFVNITFAEEARVPPDKVMALLRKNKGRIKLIPEYTLQVALPDQSLAAAAAAVKKCLQELW
jgi:transcription-repair coupling factor (superfamily II helicase)